MPQPIPNTSFTRLLDQICERSGIPRLYITRTLVTAAISAFSVKKIIIPSIKKYQKGNSQELEVKRRQEAAFNVNREKENEDEPLLAATHLAQSYNDKASSNTAAVDMTFFRRLYRLLKIMLPGVWTTEAGLLFAHSFTLIARTVISIHVALLEGMLLIELLMLLCRKGNILNISFVRLYNKKFILS